MLKKYWMFNCWWFFDGEVITININWIETFVWLVEKLKMANKIWSERNIVMHFSSRHHLFYKEFYLSLTSYYIARIFLSDTTYLHCFFNQHQTPWGVIQFQSAVWFFVSKGKNFALFLCISKYYWQTFNRCAVPFATEQI